MKEMLQNYLKKNDSFVGGTLTGFFCIFTIGIIPNFVENYNLMITLEVFVFSRESGFGATDVRCSERLGRFEEGKDLEIDPFLGTLTAPFAGEDIPNFPTKNTVLVVVGFVRIDTEQRYELLEGCIEDFGDEVASGLLTVRLDFVRPQLQFYEKNLKALKVF